VPLFKKFKISPVLGYLLAGFGLQSFGLLRDPDDIAIISEFGILFLLFEMGLELNTERLQALARYAFGVGLPQVAATTAVFTILSSPAVLPGIGGIGEGILERVFHAPAPLVSIRTVDEAVIIASALALSSSAFVLQLLQERGELATRYGAGALGVLLMQDIAVVPLLVLLPLIEAAGGLESDFGSSGLLDGAVPASLKALGALGLVVLASRTVLRAAFDFVAEARSTEAFVSLCLLTVAGTSFLTDEIGFSDTLGAFLAGVLLAESDKRNQVEVDIKPYKGILLGLFFLSTGASVEYEVFVRNWPSIFALLGGLLAVKTLVLIPFGRFGGMLSWADSTRLGILLSQGGEFAFVMLALAKDLGVLPYELNKLLIIVVILSMALTPALAEFAKVAGDFVEKIESKGEAGQEPLEADGPTCELLTADEARVLATRPIVVVGAEPVGMAVASMMAFPLSEVDAITGAAPGAREVVVIDYNKKRLPASRALGFISLPIDESNPDILEGACIDRAGAVVVCISNRQRSVRAVLSVKVNHPNTLVLAQAQNAAHAVELRKAGADEVVTMTLDTGLALGARLITMLGLPVSEAEFLSNLVRSSEITGAYGESERRSSEEESPDEKDKGPSPIESVSDLQLEDLEDYEKEDVRALASHLATVRSRRSSSALGMYEGDSSEGEPDSENIPIARADAAAQVSAAASSPAGGKGEGGGGGAAGADEGAAGAEGLLFDPVAIGPDTGRADGEDWGVGGIHVAGRGRGDQCLD